MRSRGGSVGLVALLVSLPGCAPATIPLDGGIHSVLGVYDSCDDPVGSEAFARASDRLADGDDRGAIVALQSAIERCPKLIRAHLMLIETASLLGAADKRSIEAQYRQFPDDGRDPLAPFLRARVAADDKLRLQLLDESIRRSATFQYAHAAKGRVLMALERFEPAVQSFQAALSAQPSFHEVRRDLGVALSRLGRAGEAERQLTAYVRVVPSDRVAIRELSRLLIYSLSRGPDARPLIDRLLAHDPGDRVALMDLAAIEWGAGDLDAARSLYHRVLAIDPNDARAVLNLGNLWFEAFAERNPAERDSAWRKARNAYRYFLAIRQAADGFDLFDMYLSVPFRLKQIDAALGPATEAGVALDDF